MDFVVPLMNYDPSDLGSLILIQITPKEHTLRLQRADQGPVSQKAPISTGPANLPERLTGNFTGPGIAFLEALLNSPGTYWA